MGAGGGGCASKHTGVCQRRAGPSEAAEACSPPRASQVALVVRNLPASAGEVRNTGSIPGPGRSPGGGNGKALQYSRLENPIDRGAWWATVHGVQLQLQGRAAPLPTLCSVGGWRAARGGRALWLAWPCPEGWAQLLSWFWPPWQQQPPKCRPVEDLKRQDLPPPACSQTVKDVFPRPRADQTGNGRKFSVARNTLLAKFSLQQAKIYNPQGTNLTSIIITIYYEEIGSLDFQVNSQEY